jgi:REP element-mobilizing transposase RayT
MVQGIGREHVFPDDNCKGFYLHSLQNCKSLANVKIIAFCVMSNHAHILVHTDNVASISKFFHVANADSARYYNRVFDRVGYVFRDRFKSEAIVDEKHLFNCLAYIHFNPTKAGIAASPEDYNYSSMQNYLKHSGIVDFEDASRLFDVSPSNILAIMSDCTPSKFLEHDDKVYEKADVVYRELAGRYQLTCDKLMHDTDLLRLLIDEMRNRTKASFRDIAKLTGIGRETLRTLVDKYDLSRGR